MQLSLAPSGETAGLDLTVSQFVALLNQSFEYVFPEVTISGELANFRVSKNKWVYFDLKDASASLKCFGTVYQLKGIYEDGMLVTVRGTPHLHEQYGFSLTVSGLRATGTGSIRRAQELLGAKLTAEGLFDPSRKRALPFPPKRVGLIASKQSAAYVDFMKILGARWSGIDIDLIDVQVQGEVAAGQIVAAIKYFNQLAEPPEVLVMTRGGGSADDLATFSSEIVTRAVGLSRIPTLVAIGHEIDICLAELAADKRASTPSNAAEVLVPDRREALRELSASAHALYIAIHDHFSRLRSQYQDSQNDLTTAVNRRLSRQHDWLDGQRRLLQVLSPQAALERGYAIVGLHNKHRKQPAIGDRLDIELARLRLQATVTDVQSKNER